MRIVGREKIGKMNESTVARVTELEKRIADLKARLPRHSIPPAMLIELDELEEELERARAETAQEDHQ
jgi:uncharacterized small protein (DUF1192 family)